ncbi:unnamed protein product [Ectocarpus sp. CCAP 1310/34]|nr:unnamed protein product [Ectocarpus sp. CCAP 1310/34]
MSSTNRPEVDNVEAHVFEQGSFTMRLPFPSANGERKRMMSGFPFPSANGERKRIISGSHPL